MKMKSKFAVAMAAVVMCLCGNAGAQTIIANQSVKASSVSAADLRDVFTGAATSLKDGSHVVPVTLKEGGAHESFLKEYVGKTDAAFRATWRGLVFSGQASMPKSFDSDEEVIAYVAKTPGAIGYVSKGAATGGVKVLAVH